MGAYIKNCGSIPEWAIIFTKTLLVIKSTIHYGPIRDCAFTKLLKVIKYGLNYGPIYEWVSASVLIVTVMYV